jgi:hypothetical protein
MARKKKLTPEERDKMLELLRGIRDDIREIRVKLEARRA